MHPGLAALLIPLISAPHFPQADAPQSIAGRTLSQWTADLAHPNEFVRLRAAKTLRAFGRPAVPSLSRALSDRHAGVRYWAASHLGDFATASRETVSRLKSLKSGEHPAVAMAAAYALCRVDSTDSHIELLIERLESSQRGTACCAAEFLGRLGSEGKPAVAALEAAFERHKRGVRGADYHVNGAAQNALRQILGQWEPK